MIIVNDYWITFGRPNPSPKMRIICFPYAGGGASIYSDWKNYFPAGMQVVAFQPAGRGNRFAESPRVLMEEVLIDAMDPSRNRDLFNAPYLLFGHSLGARIAFEFLRMIHLKGYPAPIHFIASASRAPQLPVTEKISCLSDDLFFSKITSYGGTPAEILGNKELMDLTFPSLRADFHISESYRYFGVQKFDCDASIFYGKFDKTVNYEDIISWQHNFFNDVAFYPVNGGHFFIKECINEVIERISFLCHRF